MNNAGEVSAYRIVCDQPVILGMDHDGGVFPKSDVV